MALGDSEARDAARFWLAVLAAGFLCVLMGRAAVTASSGALLALALALSVGVLAFYNPKIALGALLFSMLLSPRLKAAALGGPAGAQGSALEIRFDDVVLAVVFLAWLARTALLKGAAFLAPTPIHLPAFLYTAACVLSTVLGMMSGRLPLLRPAFFILKYAEYFLLFFMAVNVVEDESDVRRFARLGLVVALVVACFGWRQIPTGLRVTTPFETPVGFGAEAARQAANEANTYGGYFLVVYGMILGYFTQGGAKAARLALLALAFTLPPFLMTLSRSSYVGLAAMLLFLLAATPRRRLTLLFGFGGVLLAVFLAPAVRQAVVERVLSTFAGAAPGGAYGHHYLAWRLGLEESALIRILSWVTIIAECFPVHPLLGWGVTGVGIVDTQLPRVLGETGLLGLSLFLWMLWRIWKMAWTLFRASEDPEERSVALGLAAALVGLLFHCLGANTFIIVRIMEPFWFAAALCARLYMNRGKRLAAEAAA